MPTSSKSPGDGRATRNRVWLWLTAPVAILTAIAAGSELLVDDIFRGDAPYFVAQAIGQNFVTLTVALPSLVVAAILAGRGSGGGRLIWLGVLTYLVYTYAIYAFATRFNSLFLVYVALLGCSLYEMLPAGASGPWKRAKGRGRHNLGRIVSGDRRI